MFGTSISTFQVVTLIVGVLLPIFVALITKSTAPPAIRSITLLVLSAVSGMLNSWLVAPAGFDWSQALLDAFTVFIIGVATLYGLWKPTGVSARAKATPGFIG